MILADNGHGGITAHCGTGCTFAEFREVLAAEGIWPDIIFSLDGCTIEQALHPQGARNS